MFFSICLAKKTAEVIKFLGIFKKYIAENKIFVQERKAKFRLTKKLFLSFTQYSNLFSGQRSVTVLSTDVCVLISYFFLFSYISL